jgi:hypothetical protein
VKGEFAVSSLIQHDPQSVRETDACGYVTAFVLLAVGVFVPVMYLLGFAR